MMTHQQVETVRLPDLSGTDARRWHAFAQARRFEPTSASAYRCRWGAGNLPKPAPLRQARSMTRIHTAGCRSGVRAWLGVGDPNELRRRRAPAGVAAVAGEHTGPTSPAGLPNGTADDARALVAGISGTMVTVIELAVGQAAMGTAAVVHPILAPAATKFPAGSSESGRAVG
jgi:hypothetical protein